MKSARELAEEYIRSTYEAEAKYELWEREIADFLAGHASRDAEVQALKDRYEEIQAFRKAVEAAKSLLERVDRCGGNEVIDWDEIYNLRAVLRELGHEQD